jgi:hypothetical protein
MARAHGKSAAADHTGACSLKDTETDCPLSVVHGDLSESAEVP